MITDKLVEIAGSEPDRALYIWQDRKFTAQEMLYLSTAVADQLVKIKAKRLLLILPDSPLLLAYFFAADGLGLSICAVNHERSKAELQAFFTKNEFDTIISSRTDLGSSIISAPNLDDLLALTTADTQQMLKSSPQSRLIIMTTGTTGIPKAALYRWKNLTGQVKQKPEFAGTSWLHCYFFSHFAGMQMFVHALFNKAKLVIPRSHEWLDVLHSLQAHKVEYISATPSFWRVILNRAPHRDLAILPIKQITLGGEAADNALLLKLAHIFPEAKISHVYASTELGSCFSVRDGRSGFPVQWLVGHGDDNVSYGLKIIDGELYVKTNKGMDSYEKEATDTESWKASGDLVEIQGDRVQFLGRKSEVINVGGVKVYPQPIESLLLELPFVINAHVFGKPSKITGNIVVADVQVIPGCTETRDMEMKMFAHLAGKLDRFQMPRLINFVDEIESRNTKVVRRPRST